MPERLTVSRVFNPHPLPREVFVRFDDGRMFRALVESMETRVETMSGFRMTLTLFLTRDQYEARPVSRDEFLTVVADRSEVVPQEDDGVPTPVDEGGHGS